MHENMQQLQMTPWMNDMHDVQPNSQEKNVLLQIWKNLSRGHTKRHSDLGSFLTHTVLFFEHEDEEVWVLEHPLNDLEEFSFP